MNLTSLSQVRARLAQLDVHPSKVLGQNFLIDANVLRLLLDQAALAAADQVLEIGPGLGVITEQLLARVRRVVAVEKDRRLHAALAERFRDEPRLELIAADALDLDLDALLGTGVNKVLATLPYAVASRILVELVRAEDPPRVIVVAVQHEVALRLAAEPGTAAYGLLSLWMQLFYRAEVVRKISPTCFWPRPGVPSAIVRLTRRGLERLPREQRDFFDSLTRRAFEHRRKQLVASLAGGGSASGPLRAQLTQALIQRGIDPHARPENLGAEAWWAFAGGLFADAQCREGLRGKL
jgi:16S rRNA (adenine1518-N6/adenine1519-N6)-dimethyltransferase